MATATEPELEPIEILASRYLAQDKDHETHAELQALVASHDEAELERRLRPRIAFGTAGLRARMEAGYARMNGLTVIQASQGLAAHVLANKPDGQKRCSIVIGRDARRNSEKFARLAAAAFLAKGIEVIWFKEPVHTPMVPFTVQQCSADAGIVITASHNPKDDNGYKVYWANGCQIIPPHDAGIAKMIDANLEPISWDAAAVDAVNTSEGELQTAYFQSIRKLVNSLSTGTIRVPPCVYTPLHGVGRKPLERAIGENFKFTPDRNALAIVREQAQPDPEFPTVKFPNPEEAGALDLAFEKADAQGDELVIANDPDADRFAAAAKDVDTGKWHQFTGNEVGMLLAAFVWESRKDKDNASKYAMLNTTVSTGWLKAMAVKEGFQYRETLTGFKWLGNVAQDLARQGLEVLLAFEEALGYMLPQVVYDKDGVAAACVFLAAAAAWKAQGISLLEKLEQLFVKYGYFADANTYLIRKGPAVTPRIFADIRNNVESGQKHPSRLGTRKITRWRDLTLGYDSASSDGVPDLPIDSASQMITCELDGGRTRFTVRGSGTEPKIKLYIESQAESAAAAREEALAVQRDLIEQWFSPVKYDLTLAGA